MGLPGPEVADSNGGWTGNDWRAGNLTDGIAFIRRCTMNCSPYVPVLELLYGERFQGDNRQSQGLP
jgi:hypothetical protein